MMMRWFMQVARAVPFWAAGAGMYPDEEASLMQSYK
jgi:hypothetical protein